MMMQLLIALGMLAACEAASTKKCFEYERDATSKKYVKKATAAVCSTGGVTDDSNFKCHIPALKEFAADDSKIDTAKGCGVCPSTGNCFGGDSYTCTDDSCNVANTKECYTYTWNESDKKYKKDTDKKVCEVFAADFKCHKPKDMNTKDTDFPTKTGCGPCPTNAECPDTCTGTLCNSAATLISVVPVIMAALFALLY